MKYKIIKKLLEKQMINRVVVINLSLLYLYEPFVKKRTGICVKNQNRQ